MGEVGPSWRQVASKMGRDGAKMSHDGVKMGHASAKMSYDSAKMGIFGSTWNLLWVFWKQFLTISVPGLESKKTFKSCLFLCIC